MHYSPRQFAKAISVSESTIKRWVDKNEISCIRTEGGHRRITREDAIAFIRRKGIKIADPTLLGLPTLKLSPDEIEQDESELLFQLFITGRNEDAASYMIQQYIEGNSLPTFIQQSLSPVMAKLGQLWHCKGQSPNWEGIGIEHCATSASLQALYHIQQLMPTPSQDKPIAIVGGLNGDPYILPGVCIQAVLKQSGVNTKLCGADTPAQTYQSLIVKYRPSHVILSLSGNPQPNWQDDIKALKKICDSQDVTLVIGGQRAKEALKDIPEEFCTRCNSLNELINLCT